MAVFMNAQRNAEAVFKFGKRGPKSWSNSTPKDRSTTGDSWFDIQITKLNPSKSGDTVTWNKITENFGDPTVTGNLTVPRHYYPVDPNQNIQTHLYLKVQLLMHTKQL